jgi:hypothetical protein
MQQHLPIAFHQYSWFNLPLMIPIVGLRSEGETVEANFGKKFFFNVLIFKGIYTFKTISNIVTKVLFSMIINKN